MELGTVIFFNNETGFGVIQDDEGERVLLYYSEIRFKSKKLYEGQRVCFDVRKGLECTMALNVRLR